MNSVYRRLLHPSCIHNFKGIRYPLKLYGRRELSISTQRTDYYRTLGVGKEANQKEIKKAYYQKAKEHHPDKNKDDKDAEKKFQEIAEAYECLSDPTKRQQYDQLGSAGYKSTQQSGGGFGGGGFSGGGFGGDPHDIFNQIFKEFNRGGAGRGGASAFADMFGDQIRNQPKQYDVTMNISVKEACLGGTKRVRMMMESTCKSCNGTGAKRGTSVVTCFNCNGTGMETKVQGPFMMQQTCRVCEGTGKIIKEKCPDCRGKGTIEQLEEVSIEIPAGISENERIRTMAHGAEIYVSFKIQRDSRFKIDGLHIHSDVDISIAQAVLGGRYNFHYRLFV